MDQAFAAVWHMLRADDPFRDYASDSELKIAIGTKLLNLVTDGVTDPLRLRNLTVATPLRRALFPDAAHWKKCMNTNRRFT